MPRKTQLLTCSFCGRDEREAVIVPGPRGVCICEDCAQQVQAAKAKVQLETPVFTVINPPQVPLKQSKPSKAMILVACVFLGAVLAIVWVLWGRDFLAGLKKKEDEEEEPAAPAQA